MIHVRVVVGKNIRNVVYNMNNDLRQNLIM